MEMEASRSKVFVATQRPAYVVNSIGYVVEDQAERREHRAPHEVRCWLTIAPIT